MAGLILATAVAINDLENGIAFSKYDLIFALDNLDETVRRTNFSADKMFVKKYFRRTKLPALKTQGTIGAFLRGF